MRLDILREDAANGPAWRGRALIRLAKWFTGIRPGPIVVLQMRPKLMNSEIVQYMTRGLTGKGTWTRGEGELYAAFASKLNGCLF